MRKKLRPILILILPLILICVLIVTYFAFPWFYIGIGGALSSNSPKPEITYGEFPFRLEYKIDGEHVIVEDTVICEFDGFDWNEGLGKHRNWKTSLKNSGNKAVLITEDEERKVYCFVGDAEYYMGDETYPEPRPLKPRLYCEELTDNHFLGTLSLKYKVELLSWEFSEPIVNSFK